jgi:hypothetical protein
MAARSIIQPTSVFDDFRDQAWPYKFAVQLTVENLVGGTPSDPKVGENFIRSKLAGSEDLIRETVATLMVERGITAEQAAKEADQLKHLNGFRRDEETGELFIEGRQIKAALKEAASVAYASGKLLNPKGKNTWGLTAKGIHGFFAEHVCVPESRVMLGQTEPDTVLQKFVHTFRGSGIQYEECIVQATLNFRIWCDYPFTTENWAMVLLTGEQQGVGASRSQSYGKYIVTGFDAL